MIKLLNYRKWSKVIRIIESDNKNGDIRARDSNEKKRRSWTESSIEDYHYSSLNDDSIQKSCRSGDKSAAKIVHVNEKRYLSIMEWILVIYTALAIWLRVVYVLKMHWM